MCARITFTAENLGLDRDFLPFSEILHAFSRRINFPGNFMSLRNRIRGKRMRAVINMYVRSAYTDLHYFYHNLPFSRYRIINLVKHNLPGRCHYLL